MGSCDGPFIIGYLTTCTGSFAYGYAWLAVNLFLAGVLILCLRRHTHTAEMPLKMEAHA